MLAGSSGLSTTFGSLLKEAYMPGKIEQPAKPKVILNVKNIKPSRVRVRNGLVTEVLLGALLAAPLEVLWGVMQEAV